MSGRGDNNKHGSAGRGAGNQSNQPFVTSDEKQKKSDHNKNQTGGEPSEPQEKTKDKSVERKNPEPRQQSRQPRTAERTFDLLVDHVPYMITSVPFYYNDELRFRIHVNGNPEHIFTWDSSLGALRAIDDESSTMPVGLEEAISQELEELAMA